MKIAIITSPFCELPPDALGAVERRWFNTAEEFAKAGHSVQLIGKKGKTILEDDDNLRRVYIRGYGRTRSVYMDIILDLFYSLRALRHLQNCDVLVLNTFWSPILAPYVARRKYKKSVYNVARYPKRHLQLYKHIDCFVCTSSVVRKAFCKIVPMIGKHVVEVVNNPIDVRHFYQKERREICPFLIGYHGRINLEKGLDLLARAVSVLAEEFPNLRMRLIGPWRIEQGGGGEIYKKHIDTLSGNRIDWMGPISNRNVLAKLLMECSIYCYPSVAEQGESFGVAPLEAMGLGLPVVVSGLECFKDFVKAGENAVEFNHRGDDPVGELAQKIRGLLVDVDWQNKIGKAAAQTGLRFSTGEIAKNYISVFQKIITEGDLECVE